MRSARAPRRAAPYRWAVLGLAAALVAAMTPESPVADAAMRGDLEEVRSLLRSGADVNEPQGDGMTALHWAARRGDAALAEVLVYAGARLDAGTRIGRYTPLHVAAREGRAGVVRVLLDAGADPKAVTTNSGATPLHLAARSGDAEIVRLLVAAGAEVDAREGAWDQTPLTFAAELNRVEAIEALLKAGADPNASARVVDVVEMAAADEAAEERLQKALQQFREQQGGGPDWQPTPSQVQAAVDLARQIQTRWPDVPKDEEGNAGGRAAASQEGEAAPAAEGAAADSAGAVEPSGEGAEQPTEAGGAATSEDAEPDSAAADEKEADEPEPLSYAQQVGAWGGLAPLHHAARQGNVEATRALLAGGADVDQTTGDHTTPLLMAAVNGQWDLARVLLDAGADPTIASDAGATPLYAVLEREWQPRASYAHPTEYQQQETTYLEMMELLLEAGADPNVRLNKHLWYMEYTFGVLRGSGIDLEGATPFWRAAYALDINAMRLLAAHGADADIWTKKPPQRRRRRPMEQADTAQADTAAVAQEATGEEAAPEAQAAAGEPQAEGEAAPQEKPEEAAKADEDEEEDKSGLPPVPVGGPGIAPIHAASGVGYGQSFAGNAHRYVPNGWLPAVRFLVEEMGADVNARDHNGYTALHHAASRGDVEMIRYLVEHGADVTVVSRKGETTADMANGPVQRVQPYPEAIALLESLGSENNHNCVSCQ